MVDSRTLPPAAVAVPDVPPATDAPVPAALRAQVPHARVTVRCGCGCAAADGAEVMVLTHGGPLRGPGIHSVQDTPVRQWPDVRPLSLGTGSPDGP